jgi:hypothetical protein
MDCNNVTITIDEDVDTPMRQNTPKRIFPVLVTAVLILIIVTTCTSGCIRMFQQGTDTASSGDATSLNTAEMNSTSVAPRNTSAPPAPPVAAMTPAKSSVVTEVAPIRTVDPYPIIHGTRINETAPENPLYRTPDFEKRYHLAGNATGLLVNAPDGPLYIVFEVIPLNDCLINPTNCRGDLLTPINRPYMTITVRDNQTGEIVAQDGFGQIYSSDTGRYKFSYTSQNKDSLLSSGYSQESETSTSSEPGPRYIPIYKEGTFHITIEGNFLDVNVWILTGDSPSQLEINNGVMPVKDTSSDDGF